MTYVAFEGNFSFFFFFFFVWPDTSPDKYFFKYSFWLILPPALILFGTFCFYLVHGMSFILTISLAQKAGCQHWLWLCVSFSLVRCSSMWWWRHLVWHKQHSAVICVGHKRIRNSVCCLPCTINICHTNKPSNRAKFYADLSNTKTSQIISLYIFSHIFRSIGKSIWNKEKIAHCYFSFFALVSSENSLQLNATVSWALE